MTMENAIYKFKTACDFFTSDYVDDISCIYSDKFN